jgi:hypothetical protein
MFVPRSAGRIRLARLAFVIAGLVPLAGLVAAAVHLRSNGHREAVRRDWQRAIGLPVAIGRVVHPRPGVIRAEGVVVAAPDGVPTLSLPMIEVETAAGEVRLRVSAVGCDAAAAGLLAGLAREWLGRGARYDRDCVVEVDEFTWRLAEDRPSVGAAPAMDQRVPPSGAAQGLPAATQPASLRVECVSQSGARALRVVRGPVGALVLPDHRDSPAGGRPTAAAGRDELRIVRTTLAPEDAAEMNRIDIEASCGSGLPFGILAAVAAGTPLGGWTLGAAAVVTGSLTGSADGATVHSPTVPGRTVDGGRWRFAAEGRIEGVELRDLAASIGLRAGGVADIVVPALEWRDGRLAACDLAADVGPGHVERRFLEAMVSTLGCRPGPALTMVADERGDSRFDAASCRLRLSAAGLELTAGQRLGGPLAVSGGLPLVEPPGAVVPGDRLAWLLSSPGSGYAPASGPGAWLMSILPAGARF